MIAAPASLRKAGANLLAVIGRPADVAAVFRHYQHAVRVTALLNQDAAPHLAFCAKRGMVLDELPVGDHIRNSGSRNLGLQVAKYYQNLAVDLNKGKEEYLARRDALIAEYKAAGRRTEIQDALKKLKWQEKQATIPEDLCFVYGRFLEDYLHDVEICQRFARQNRELMAKILLADDLIIERRARPVVLITDSPVGPDAEAAG